MDYLKQKNVWYKRRLRAVTLIASGVARKEVAKRLGITRQRLSQIEREMRAQ